MISPLSDPKMQAINQECLRTIIDGMRDLVVPRYLGGEG